MSLLERLSLNQITAGTMVVGTNGAQLFAQRIPYIGAWRHKLDGDVTKPPLSFVAQACAFPAFVAEDGFPPHCGKRRERIADNRRAIEEAAAPGGAGAGHGCRASQRPDTR